MPTAERNDEGRESERQGERDSVHRSWGKTMEEGRAIKKRGRASRADACLRICLQEADKGGLELVDVLGRVLVRIAEEIAGDGQGAGVDLERARMGVRGGDREGARERQT